MAKRKIPKFGGKLHENLIQSAICSMLLNELSLETFEDIMLVDDLESFVHVTPEWDMCTSEYCPKRYRKD